MSVREPRLEQLSVFLRMQSYKTLKLGGGAGTQPEHQPPMGYGYPNNSFNCCTNAHPFLAQLNFIFTYLIESQREQDGACICLCSTEAHS